MIKNLSLLLVVIVLSVPLSGCISVTHDEVVHHDNDTNHGYLEHHDASVTDVNVHP